MSAESLVGLTRQPTARSLAADRIVRHAAEDVFNDCADDTRRDSWVELAQAARRSRDRLSGLFASITPEEETLWDEVGCAVDARAESDLAAEAEGASSLPWLVRTMLSAFRAPLLLLGLVGITYLVAGELGAGGQQPVDERASNLPLPLPTAGELVREAFEALHQAMGRILDVVGLAGPSATYAVAAIPLAIILGVVLGEPVPAVCRSRGRRAEITASAILNAERALQQDPLDGDDDECDDGQVPEVMFERACRLRAETLAALAEWSTDLAAVLFDRPLLGDPTDPYTAAFNEAFDVMLDAVPETPPAAATEEGARAALDAAEDAWDAWAAASKRALNYGLGDMSAEERNGLALARKYLNVAANPGAAAAERHEAIRRVIRTLVGITARPTDAIEREVFKAVNESQKAIGAPPLQLAVEASAAAPSALSVSLGTNGSARGEDVAR